VGDWESIKQFLETPWLGNLLTVGQILWGLLGSVVLGGLAWFYKNVLKAMGARLAGWVRGLPKKIYAQLGLVTRADNLKDEVRFQDELVKRDERIAAFEKELQGLNAVRQKPIAAPAAPVPPPITGWTGPNTIERFEVKFTLVDPIGNYLGKFNPPAVPDNMIKAFLHGPFCRNCNYSLIKSELMNGIMQDVVAEKCPMCTLMWRKSELLASDLLRQVYNVLDAEFRSNKSIAETDVKDGTLRSFFDPLPSKPW
jgi:hypothetical protein